MARVALPNVGSWCIVRQLTPEDRWKSAGSPEYAPNWIARVKLPSGVRKVSSTLCPICEPCLAVPAGISPVVERADCRCQKPAKTFAERQLNELLRAWQQNREAVVSGVRRSAGTVMLVKVAELFEASGPPDAGKRVRRWKEILEQGTGRPFADLSMEVMGDGIVQLVLKWAAMRQEYARRGWSKRGETALPANAWALLRSDWEAGRIPKQPDYATVRACNTTITGYVRDMKSVFAKRHRTRIFTDLKLPPLGELRDLELALKCPKGFRRIPREQYRAMWEAAKVLRETDPQMWVVVQLAWRTGIRTIEIQKIKPHWLETRTGRKNKAENGTFLVLKNRPEEGFALKAADRAIVRSLRLPRPLVVAIRSIETPDTVLGAHSVTELDRLTRRASAWVRQYVPEGPHTLYWFRHLAGVIHYTQRGGEVAGGALGHATGSSVTTDRYASDFGDDIDALTDKDLHPDKLGALG